MILHLSKSRLNLAALAFIGLTGCGSEAGSTATGTEAPAPGASPEAPANVQAIGGVTGHFRNGHVSFDAMQPTAGGVAPGLTTQGFGTFTLSKLTFDTDVGDGVGVSGIPEGCTATQYCARVSITNNTGVAIQSLFSEITDYFLIAPTGVQPAWAGTPFTRSQAYKSVFVHGTSGTLEAADYGDFAVGETKKVSFIFEINGATTFDFHVTEYATFPRNQISGSGINNASATNACATPGNSLITDLDDDEKSIDLPFPFTMVDRTYDKAVVGSNGYMLFYSTGNTPPTLGSSNNNTNIGAGYQLPGMYPFWDDLAYDSGDGAVCYQTLGTKPNRTFIVSWSNAKISNNQPILPKTFAAEKITYSVSMAELSDNFRLIYTLPSGGTPPSITNLTRGSSATIMFVYFQNGGLGSQVYGYNGPSLPPASALSYPYAFNGTQYNFNP